MSTASQGRVAFPSLLHLPFASVLGPPQVNRIVLSPVLVFQLPPSPYLSLPLCHSPLNVSTTGLHSLHFFVPSCQLRALGYVLVFLLFRA